MTQVKILAIEPYYGLSHKSFLEGYRKYSRHQVEIWALPPRKWKWRMRGSAYHFAELAREAELSPPDALLVSDFLNLPDFLSLAPRSFRGLPTVAYFHENQVTYPLGKGAPVDFHYGWINLSTALAADLVLFNSYYHREEFLRAVRQVLGRMPDHVPTWLSDRLMATSKVFPVGIDFALHDAEAPPSPRPRPSSAPVVLWNHRWEYDKGPETFFGVLRELRRQGVPFRLAVCGQSFKKRPEVFDRAQEELRDRIDHFGYFPDPKDYFRCLHQSDVVVSTAVHEFFGVSVVDAIYCGCLPILPRRLSYPEIIPVHLQPLFLYDADSDLAAFLGRTLARPPSEYRDELRAAMRRFDWRELAGVLDREMESLRGA